MAAIAIFLFLFFASSQGYTHWSSPSPPDGHVIYACVGDTVNMTWLYVLEARDTVNDIEWTFSGHSNEMVAIFSHGMFFPTPVFSNRVTAVGNAGISLREVAVGDSGNFTVEVHVITGTSFQIVFKRTVFLHVNDALMTWDALLHASQTPDAVVAPDTNQLSLQLQCGAFIFPSQPPLQVEWTTPVGQVVNSTEYYDHHFRLLLQNPIQGGNYSCRISPQHADNVCTRGNDGRPAVATVFVDKMEARLSLLEKENQMLKGQLAQTNYLLLLTNTTLTQELHKTSSNLNSLTQELHQTSSNLNSLTQELHQTRSNLTQEDDHLKGRLQALEDAARQQVAFHANSHSLSSYRPTQGNPLIFSNVVYNHGNAYSNTTGYFVAPYPGIYCFFVTTGGLYENNGAYFYLYVDNTRIAFSYNYRNASHFDYSTVHGLLHLDPGQRVWIMGDGNAYNNADSSMFTGFLLAHGG